MNQTADDAAAAIDRIVVIHDFAAPEGGAGIIANMAAREFARRGIPVTFFAGAADGGALALAGIDLAGLHQRRLLEQSRARAMVQGVANHAARDSLQRWIAKHDTDRTIYHLHNWSQILSPAIFQALAGVEERLVVTCHDFFNVCPNGGFTNFARSLPCNLAPLSPGCLISQCDRRGSAHKYWRIVRQIHLARVARPARAKATFTFLHERMQARFVAGGFRANRMTTIGNPVEVWSRQRIPAERNREFLFVGRLGRDKGADLAAAAAARCGVPVTLVGEGELAADLRAGPGDIRLAGWCDRAGILAHARRARALIVPSRVVEPFGLVILEAAMSGLPVIVTDRAYLAADAERLGFGTSFDPSAPDQLAERIAMLAAIDAQVERMSRNGINRAGELALSVADWGDRFVTLFGALLPARPAPVAMAGCDVNEGADRSPECGALHWRSLPQ